MLVNTADEVSKQRNIERGQRGGRTVPENIRKEKWDAVQVVLNLQRCLVITTWSLITLKI